MISIRSKNEENGAIAANLAYDLIAEGKTPITELSKAIIQLPDGTNAQISVSDEFHHVDKEVSESYKASLSELSNNSFSRPIAQKSRLDKSTVFRIFYLKEHLIAAPISLQESENRVKDKLIEIAAAKESDKYLNKLRKHFDIKADDIKQITAGDFQPFLLKEK